jgi:protein-S-isoprenylcysteine O-methyltransferase Ste14
VNELVFRLVALVVSVGYMTIRLVFERRLKRPSKREEWARADARDRRGLAVIAVTTVPMWVYMLSPLLDFARMGLPDALRWAGLAVAAVGVAAFTWSHAALASNWSPFVEQPPGGMLVTSGPYRWVRHPMYTSFLLYNAGMMLLVSNWIGGVPALLGFVWFYFDRVGREERMMADRFGERYAEWASRTGRVVPGIGRDRR